MSETNTASWLLWQIVCGYWTMPWPVSIDESIILYKYYLWYFVHLTLISSESLPGCTVLPGSLRYLALPTHCIAWFTVNNLRIHTLINNRVCIALIYIVYVAQINEILIMILLLTHRLTLATMMIILLVAQNPIQFNVIYTIGDTLLYPVHCDIGCLT